MKVLSRDPIDTYCDLLDRLAKLEHEQWMEWSKTLASKEKLSQDRLERWKKLWVPYDLLPIEDKRSDIKWARKVLNEIPKLCPMLENLRKMLQCHECPYYKRCLRLLDVSESQ